MTQCISREIEISKRIVIHKRFDIDLESNTVLALHLLM